MEIDDQEKEAAIAKAVAQLGTEQGQAPVVESIRRGNLHGTRTTMPDGTKLIIWQEARSKTIGINNVRGGHEAKFNGSLHAGGPKSY